MPIAELVYVSGGGRGAGGGGLRLTFCLKAERGKSEAKNEFHA